MCTYICTLQVLWLPLLSSGSCFLLGLHSSFYLFLSLNEYAIIHVFSGRGDTFVFSLLTSKIIAAQSLPFYHLWNQLRLQHQRFSARQPYRRQIPALFQ